MDELRMKRFLSPMASRPVPARAFSWLVACTSHTEHSIGEQRNRCSCSPSLLLTSGDRFAGAHESGGASRAPEGARSPCARSL